MTILGIDPGNEQSAFVTYDFLTKKPLAHCIMPNTEGVRCISGWADEVDVVMAVEMVACYGMPVGAEVFETCLWIGRFIQAWCQNNNKPWHKIYRREEKIHLCGNMKAKDGNIRQAIMDRYGSSRQAAIGIKKSPGPLYSFAGDEWSALAVAIVCAETKGKMT